VLIGFIGDVHGQVFHAIAAVATWQARTGQRFDLLIQVGDLGAYPDPARMDAASRQYLAVEPAQADFSRLLRAEGKRAETLRSLRGRVASAVHFIRGNHEDFAWLRQLPVDLATTTAPVDPFDLFRYVPDGTLLERAGFRIAFLGGADDQDAGEGAIDPTAHQSLLGLGPGKIDLLITHDAPYGISVGYYGQTQGSRLITQLIERTQPTFHVAGHLALNGPRFYGRTTFLCLDGLVESRRWHPTARGLAPGCLAVLDTAQASLSPVMDPWLSTFDTPFDFDRWAEAFDLR